MRPITNPWHARAVAYAITAAALVLLFTLSGCSTRGLFENRVTCTMDGQGQILSRWAGFGIATDLAPEDAARVCRDLAARLPQGHPLQVAPQLPQQPAQPQPQPQPVTGQPSAAATPAADSGSAPQRGPLVRYPSR